MKPTRFVPFALVLAFIIGSFAFLGAGPGGPPEKEVVIFVHYPRGQGPPEEVRPPKPGGGGTSCPSRTFAKWTNLSLAMTFAVDTSASGVAGTGAFDGAVAGLQEWDRWSGLPAPSAAVFSGLPSSYLGQSNNRNEVAWASLGALGYTNAIAVTWTWRYRTTKEAVEWDMVLNNDPGFAWAQNSLAGADPNTATGLPGLYDVQAIATHEAGHGLGLDHVQEASHTMYPYAATGEVKKRSLECGDKAGIQKLYGAG